MRISDWSSDVCSSDLPAESEVMPSQADTRSRVTREIGLNIPILSSAMDTVTDADMAIVMAQLGGIGVLHRNVTIEEQIGSASCRERVCKDVSLAVVAVTLNKKNKNKKPK